MACPDENVVLGFVEGRLDGEALLAADAHLAACDDCRQVVAALARGSIPAGETGGSSGSRVGRYLLLETIGRGGMGVVHAAWDPELDRRIAVKLLRADLREREWDQARVRLLREGRAIARLAHPNVVAVHDVGDFAEGVFVAMEYVDGGALSAWRDEPHALDEIIVAFEQAARGIAAAHDAGLIHRDVKPANVLMGADGRVRVVDFGLARAPGATELSATRLEDDSDQGLTVTGTLVGTPLYMAPETMTGAPADEKSDQYGLAASLYEVVAGVKPFAGRTLVELHKAKRARALVPPLRRVPPRLLRVLERALAPEPADRWSTMHRLADQLRWLLGQKRRWLYSAAAVAIVGLAAGVPLVLARDDRCARGEERLAGIWDRPAVAATVGDRTTQKLVAYAHEWVDGYRRVCEATHVRGDQSESLLDLRMRCLDDRRRALGALATVLTTRADATTQANAVSAAGSLPAIADCDALETLVEILPPPATARAQVDALTPRLDEAEALERAGHFADSLTLAEKVAADAQPLGYRALDARVALLVGDLQQQLGDPKAAEAALHRAAQAAAEARDDVAAAKAWTLLVGVVGYLGGRPDEGLALARFADAAVARANAADSVGADLDSMRGLVYDALGQYDEARRHHERALATRERTLGPDHLEVAQVLDNLGAIPLEQRRWDEAEKHYARALDIRRRQLGEDHPDVGASWNSLGAAQRGKGARETALASYEKAHRIWQRSLGPDHPNLAAALNNIGNLERELGRPRPAREHLRAALELWRRVSPVEHAASIAIVVSNLGLLAHEANDLEGAEALLAEALPLLEAALGKEHPRLTVTLHNLAEVKRERGDCAAAEPLFRRALALREAKLGKDHVDVADPLVGLGQCRLAAGDAPGALPLLERAVLLRRTSSDAKENATAEAELQRARILAGKR